MTFIKWQEKQHFEERFDLNMTKNQDVRFHTFNNPNTVCKFIIIVVLKSHMNGALNLNLNPDVS